MAARLLSPRTNEFMRIALDAMGGDDAPQPNVDGAIAALEQHADLEIALVGDQAVLDGLLNASGYSGERISVVHAEDPPMRCGRNRTIRLPFLGN
jgi:glycerol-3-phosphate acyltransferase PlsX